MLCIVESSNNPIIESFRDGSVLRLWRGIKHLEHIIDDLPQTALQRKVIVHQVDQEVVVVDVLDDHA